MPQRITFSLFDTGGESLEEASPTFVKFVDPEGVDISLVPTIQEVGDGFYEFSVDVAVNPTVAFVINCGALSSTKYVVGSVGSVVAFAMYDAVGELDEGLTPVFESFTDGTADAPAPELVDLEDGLWGFWPEVPVGKTYYFTVGDGDNFLAGSVGSQGLDNVVPTGGSDIEVTTPVTFDVLDTESALGRVLIAVEYPSMLGATELAYDGDGAVGAYTVTVTEVTDGKHYSVLRSGGWPAPFTVRVVLTNADGRELGYYSLTPDVLEMEYPTIIDLFQDPPVSISELFKQLSYGELHDLKVGLAGIGQLKEERWNQVVHLANEGLKRLHQRFELIHPYQLVDVPAEGVVIPLSTMAIQVISLLMEDGTSLTFRTHPIPGEIFVFNRKLSFPEGSGAYKVQVTWQNRHPLLHPITQPSDLEQPIYLSTEMWAALRSYIAAEMYGNMSTSDAAGNAAKYRGKYEAVCTEMQSTGGTVQGMLDKQVFHERGWV
jgi:hypothetical protein